MADATAPVEPRVSAFPMPTLTRRQGCLIAFLPLLIVAAWMELGLRQVWFDTLGKTSVIAGSAPNVVAVLLLVFAYGVIKGNAADARPAKLSTMGVVAMAGYELIQRWMPGRTFDVSDLIASRFGGLLAYGVLVLIDRGAGKPIGSG